MDELGKQWNIQYSATALFHYRDRVRQELGVHHPHRRLRAAPRLANSQLKELEKFLLLSYPDRRGPVSFARYTGQESDEERQRIIANPPDILLTNYVMLELILTRVAERKLLASQMLQFLVLDELHTYRGRQGADVALLVRRLRDRLAQGEHPVTPAVGECAPLAANDEGASSYDALFLTL